MSVIIILILASTLVAVLFLGAFIWAARSGQFDDTHGPSVRILFDSKKSPHTKEQKKKSTSDS